MANPFYIEPPNALQAILAGQQGYDTAQKAYKQNQIDAARAGLAKGGLTPQSLSALVAAGDPQAPALYGALNQQATLAENTRFHKASEEQAQATLAENARFHKASEEQASKTFGLAERKANERQFQVTKDEDENPIIIEHGGGKPAQVYRFGPNGSLLPAGAPSNQAFAPTVAAPPPTATPQASFSPTNPVPDTRVAQGFQDVRTDATQEVPAASPTMPTVANPPRDFRGKAKREFEKTAAHEQAKMAVTQPAAEGRVNTAISNIDRLIEAATEIRDSKHLPRITGISGKLPNIPGGEAANLQAKFDTLKSQIITAALQAMRDNSKTGGALGQVSDRENIMLGNNLAALDRAQDYASMKRELSKIVAWGQRNKVLLKSTFKSQFGSDLPELPVAPPGDEGWTDLGGGIRVRERK